MTLPDSLEAQVLEIYAEGEGERLDRVDELCRKHPEQSAEIRALASGLDGTRKRIQASVNDPAGLQNTGLDRMLRALRGTRARRVASHFDEALAATESVAPVRDAGIATALPDAIQREILAIRSQPDEKRADKIEDLCSQHPEQAPDIRALLEVLEGTERRVQASVQSTSAVPDRIGPYMILDTLGEGGMGTVYLARQTEPVQRKVALKLIKLGMDSQQVLRRFEAERQALAMMEHSAIAKVYDAGTTERGQPFFVMEHIEGQPFTQYCDEKQLSLEERLHLFCQVCAGVQHAHQKGVIHRDLKPSNVLVAVEDGAPTPKIIDFGIARATDQRLVEATLFTEQGQIIGTPEYMSPEQAGLQQQDIDTRSDVYSLGVFLYELLVGSRPFSSKELRQVGLSEMERKIREVNPVRPSTRLNSTNGDGAQVAELRGTDLTTLTRRLKGDLDWIVMKSLEKDRVRRYQTAIELAQDIGRHLTDEPVFASPPSLRYKAGKFVRRYRGQVIAAGALFLVLLVGMIGTASNMVEAQANEATAEALAGAARLRRVQHRVRELELYQHPAWPGQIDAMEAWIDTAEAVERELPNVEKELEALRATAVVDPEEQDGYFFADEETRSRHDKLETLRVGLQSLSLPEGDLFRTRNRLAWAKQVDRLTLEHPNAPFTWDKAREAIEKADGDSASYLYAATVEPIDLQPQMGLVPLGADPDSLFWEFYHLRSAADPNVIPKRDANGLFDVTDETGIIFVLVPGGVINTFPQTDDPGQINYVSRIEEDPIEVPLPSFLLSKYEMTQSQWKRLSFGGKPSYYYEGYEHLPTGERVTGAHPVEYVTWFQAVELLLQDGMRLPSEVEWEYACRADTPPGWRWFSGENRADLREYANILDQTGNRAGLTAGNQMFAEFDDGFGIHAPVGSLKPNPWGLYDMLGNVFEYCLDLSDHSSRANRGGGFAYNWNVATSGGRNNWSPFGTNKDFGVRPARSLERQR